MAQLRIVKLAVIPFVVVDDGENLYECKVDPLEIQGADVEEMISGGGLAEALKKLAERFEG